MLKTVNDYAGFHRGMRHSLLRLVSARYVACLFTAGGLGFNSLAAFAVNIGTLERDVEAAQVTTMAVVAHHGGEGSSASLLTPAAAVSPVLTTTVKGQVSAGLSDSLWGNLLLSMAYQRDPEIRSIMRRLNGVNALTMLSVAGVSGLGLAQSIVSYREIKPLTVDVTPPHHPGGSDHVHFPQADRTPSILGIVGSGVTIGTLGIRTVANKYYARRLQKRQRVIQQAMEDILASLESKPVDAQVEQQLITYVGPRAAREFLQLWKTVHPVSGTT
jgi:hypothetical protein